MAAFLVFTMILVRARAEDAGGGPAPCATIPADRAAALKSAGGETAQSCRDQIKRSIEACVKDPEVTDQEKKSVLSYADVQVGGPSLYEKQTAAWTEGYARYAGAANLCRDEDAKVASACDAATNDLKTASRAQTSGAGVQSRATLAATLQLQNQIDLTVKAKAAATRAIENQTACVQAQADAMAGAVQTLQLNAFQETPDVRALGDNPLAPPAAGDPAPASIGPEANAAGGTKSLTELHKSPELQDFAVGAAGGIPVVGAPLGLAYAARGGDWAGGTQTAIGVADGFALAGEGVAGRALGVAGGPIGLFAVSVAAPVNSQSACADTNNYDPAARTRGGCSGIAGVSQSSLNAAMGTLGAP